MADRKDTNIEREHEPNAFVRWKHTLLGRFVWLILDIVIAYVFVSLAIDSGALWQYAIALFFAGDGVYNLARLITLLLSKKGRSR